MADFLADVRYSLRVLLKSPGFTIVAVLTLALGIGANTAIFSVIDHVLLRPLPFAEAERIMRVARHFPSGNGTSVSIPKFMVWRNADAFQSMAAYDFGAVGMNLGAGDRPNPVNGLHVTSQFFDVFGVKPIAGRTFSAEQDLPNAGKFAVATQAVWKNRLGGDPGLIGKTVLLNGEPYWLLGVLPEGYQPDPPTDFYLPEQFDPNSTNQGHIYYVAGRLRNGASIELAKAQLKVIGDRFRRSHPDVMDKTETVGVIPLREAIGGEIRAALLILAGAVSFVLLMACANVASLLLARATGRQREIAVRAALGAARGRIIRQLLTESMMLAGLGAMAGLFLGVFGVRILLAFSPGNLPRINDPEHPASTMAILDWRVLAFLFGLSLLTGLVFGLLPALRVSRLDVNSILKESSSRSGTGRGHDRIRGLLVAGEIALAVVLLACSALMIRTFAGLRSVKTGLDAANVLTMKTGMAGSRYATTATMESIVRRATERIEAIPGVESAAGTLALPMEGAAIDLPFTIDGRAPKDGKWEGDEQWRLISPHYFAAFRIPLLRGRIFDQRDTGASQHVVVVSKSFANKYWPHGDPVGHVMLIGKGLGPDFEEPPRQVVGIVGDVTEVGLADGMVPLMYVPQAQTTDGLTKLGNSLIPFSWVIRTKGDPALAAPAARRVFETLDAQLSPSKVLPMSRLIADSTARQDFEMLLLTVFAGIALLLAAVGIYGLMSYAVEQKTQEIGIRMALGADQTTTMRMILGQGMRLAAAGIAVGLAAAYALTRVLGGLLFGVKANDPVAFCIVALVLAAIAALAAFVPARRAMRLDPILALRHE